MSIYNIAGNQLSAVYGIVNSELNNAYDISGNVVYEKGGGGVIDYSQFTVTPLYTLSSSLFPSQGMQGLAIYNNVMFQFVANDSVTLLNLADGTKIATLPITSSHGDAASFSDEFYDPDDEFPLLYVTSDSNPAYVYVNRVNRTSATLIRSLYFPDISLTGYYAAHAYDYEHKIMYMVGYTQNNYQTDPDGNNKMIISAWDLSNIDITDTGTITPPFIESFTIPFIYVAQGQIFHDGLIFVTSGYPNTVQKCYIIDPISRSVKYTLTLSGTAESEGVDFINNEMIYGQRPYTYSKYTFAEE